VTAVVVTVAPVVGSPMASFGIEVPFSSAQVAARAALAGRSAVATAERSTKQPVRSLRLMVGTKRRVGDEGAEETAASYLPRRREHNRTWGQWIEPLAPTWGRPPRSSCGRPTPYVLLQLRQHAGREEPGRRKPVTFFNDKQALIDVRVLLAER
jgi:hypothetical protein